MALVISMVVQKFGQIIDDLATDNDGSCYKYGCTEVWADNYGEYATIDDESCYRYGCTSNLAVNYDEYATIDNDNCDFDIITHLNMSFDVWNTSIDLSSGWNMFGYGCPTPINLAEGLSNHTDKITIVKDNNGAVYMPEFGFNGIGDLTPGYGYQIKLTEAIEGFSLCDWYVNDIPEDNIVSLQEENADLNQQIKCLTNPEIGDFCHGGIIFYMDTLSQNGFVAATQDLINNNVDPVTYGVPEGFEWGCYGIDIETSSTIGSGYSNTLSIVNQNCQTQNGGLSAAEAALNYEDNEYSDWYLPSKDELLEIYNNIGQNQKT